MGGFVHETASLSAPPFVLLDQDSRSRMQVPERDGPGMVYRRFDEVKRRLGVASGVMVCCPQPECTCW